MKEIADTSGDFRDELDIRDSRREVPSAPARGGAGKRYGSMTSAQHASASAFRLGMLDSAHLINELICSNKTNRVLGAEHGISAEAVRCRRIRLSAEIRERFFSGQKIRLHRRSDGACFWAV